MAWQNASLTLSPDCGGELLQLSYFESIPSGANWYYNQYSPSTSPFLEVGTLKTTFNFSNPPQGFFLQNGDFKLKGVVEGNYYYIYIVGTGYSYYYGAWNISNMSNHCITMYFGINEDTQKGSIVFSETNPSNYKVYLYSGSGSAPQQFFNTNLAYNWIKQFIQPVYTWQSVPSISGKNGILSFSMINDEDLGDGSAVSGASSDVVNRIEPDTSFAQLLQNTPVGYDVDLYSGQVDYIRIHRTTVATLGGTISFYMAGGSTPFFNTTPMDFAGLYLSFIIDDENQVAKLSCIRRNGAVSPITFDYNLFSMSDSEMSQMYLFLKGHIVDEEGDSTDNFINSDEGGNGWSPYTDVDLEDDGIPMISAGNTGFITMYHCDKNGGKLEELAQFMWSDNFITNIKNKLFNDPSKILIGIMIMPLTGDLAGTETEIAAGGINTGVTAKKLTSQYKTIDMGYCNIHEISHTFLDYPPGTSVTIFLPYCGEHRLDVNDIQNKKLHLKYTFDLLTGSCVAKIAVNDSWKYSFSGSAGVSVPTSSDSFMGMYGAIIGSIGTIGASVATIASGAAAAPIALGISSGAKTINNLLNAGEDVSYSSGGASATGFLGIQKPYIKIETPNPLLANSEEETEEDTLEIFRQYNFLGKPCYQNKLLINCSGYTKCLSVHIEGLNATNNELEQIENWLTSGVLIRSDGSSTPSGTPSQPGFIPIHFMHCESERNVIGKKWDTPTAIEGKLLYEQSISTPTILIEGNMIGYNYCYINIFSRFYWIKDVKAMRNNMTEVYLEVDPLQSFKSDILNCRAIIERQENNGNLYMSDNFMWAKTNKTITIQPFTNGDASYRDSKNCQSFNRANSSYILSIAGYGSGTTPT